jgi:hypothetical protein
LAIDGTRNGGAPEPGAKPVAHRVIEVTETARGRVPGDL